MHRWNILLILVVSISLTACGAAPTEPAAAASPTVQTTPSPSPVQELPTPIPTETPTLTAPLDGQTTFAVIAAVQGNVATIQLWLSQGLSVFERQAVVRPLAETSVAPLGDILQNFTPAPTLAESWTRAAELHTQFYPLLQSWIEGETDDAAFGQSLDDLASQPEEMMTTAEEIAQTQLGVDTTLYGPDYTLANDIVFTLSPLIGGSERTQPAPQETAELVVQQLTPFTYSFAGVNIFTVVGVLEHTGSAPQTGVQIEVRFYNNEDTLLGITTGVLEFENALPGNQYPFNASTITQGEEKDLFKWTRYETRVLSRKSNSTTYQDFTLTLTSTEANALGEIKLTGTLTNSGRQTAPVGTVHIGVVGGDSDMDSSHGSGLPPAVGECAGEFDLAQG
ncbi:MAG: FxLYD domain-containing protein, partial [Anaerolineales bacterium]